MLSPRRGRAIFPRRSRRPSITAWGALIRSPVSAPGAVGRASQKPLARRFATLPSRISEFAPLRLPWSRGRDYPNLLPASMIDISMWALPKGMPFPWRQGLPSRDCCRSLPCILRSCSEATTCSSRTWGFWGFMWCWRWIAPGWWGRTGKPTTASLTWGICARSRA